MSTVVITNIKKISKYIALFILAIIGLYVITITLQFIFNLGTYLGTFMRSLYAFLCN